MLMNKRRRVVGFLLALAVPAVVGAIAVPASALTLTDPVLNENCAKAPNLVTNCGFEAATGASVPGWTHLVNVDSAVYNVNGATPVAAHSGNNILSLLSATGDDVWTQTIHVAPHTSYLIGAWVLSTDGGSGPNDNFTLSATNIGSSTTGTVVYSTSNTNMGWTNGAKILTTGSGRSMTITLSGRNAPSHTWVDDVYVLPQRSGCAAIANNLVENCGFENSTVDPWVDDTNGAHTGIADWTGNGGSHSLYLGSLTTDDRWHQVLAVRPHTKYTLMYAVEYWSGGGTVKNDLHVSVSNVPAASGGVFTVSTSNIGDRFWATVTKTFTTGNGSTATLTIAGANTPEDTFVDDVSVTAVPHVRLTAKGRATTTTLTGLGGQKVELEKLVNKSWRIIHTWTAPKTGWSKAWSFTVGSGGTYRSISASAPGYRSAVSSSIAIK